ASEPSAPGSAAARTTLQWVVANTAEARDCAIQPRCPQWSQRASLFGKYPGPHNIPFGADVIDKAMNVASLYLQYEDPRSTMGQQPGPPNTEDFCRGNLRARRRRSRNERRQRAADRRPACRARLSTR